MRVCLPYSSLTGRAGPGDTGLPLFDGAQQRLVSMGLLARMARESVPAELVDLKGDLAELVSGLKDTSSELSEISRGIPQILSEGGLAPALEALAPPSHPRELAPADPDSVIDAEIASEGDELIARLRTQPMTPDGSDEHIGLRLIRSTAIRSAATRPRPTTG